MRKMTVNEKRAYGLFVQGKSMTQIAKEVGVSTRTLRRWKKEFDWEGILKAGKFFKGQNPASHHNGTGPPGNRNAMVHGLRAKWLPEEVEAIVGEMPNDELSVLWKSIQLQWAAIMRAQKIMYVESQEDLSRVLTMDGKDVQAWEVQQAWDKQAKFLNAQTRAVGTLSALLKNYQEMANKDWGLTKAVERARLDLLHAQKKQLDLEQEGVAEAADDGFLEALAGSSASDWASADPDKSEEAADE